MTRSDGFRVTTYDPTHASDGALLAIVDNEPARDAAIDEHLARCASCAARLQRFRELSASVSSEIASMSVPAFDGAAMRARLTRAEVHAPRRRSWIPMATRIAATIVLVAGAAWASPVRGWIARQFTPTTESEPATPAAPTATPAAVSPKSGMVVRFTASTELVVRLDARPTGGVLELSSATDRQVSAQIAAHASSEEMMVLPGELRILNSTASTADYRITVPETVRAVRLIIGTDAARIIRLGRDTRESIRLGR